MFGTGFILDMLRNEEATQNKQETSRESPESDVVEEIERQSPVVVSESTVTAVTVQETIVLEESTVDPSTETCDEQPSSTSEIAYHMHYEFSEEPRLLLTESASFNTNSSASSNNFLKGCKWSPDGSCLLTNSDDRSLRVFTLPMEYYSSNFDTNEQDNLTVLSMLTPSEMVYDYCWYPLMQSSSSETCLYAYTSADHPIKLCDAVTSQLRCTYLPINHLDEVAYAQSIAFSCDGQRLYSGFNKTIRVFDMNQPRKQILTKKTWQKREGGQSGIISCIAMCPTTPNFYACGSYSRTVATYSDDSDEGPLSVMQTEQMNGVTHIVFHPNGNYLYSGGRMDSAIVCWDIRFLGRLFAVYEREASTNQRFYFDIDTSGRYLVSGSSNNQVRVWDISKGEEDGASPILQFQAHNAAVNGASLNPCLPILATSSGQRVFARLCDEDEPAIDSRNEVIEDCLQSEPMFAKPVQTENTVKLWLIGSTSLSKLVSQ